MLRSERRERLEAWAASAYLTSSNGKQTMDAGTSPERPSPRTITTRCCIVGGGPAGMMLGYLLGRAGIDVVVLEKHADFFRDFRGDTCIPRRCR